MQIFVISTRCYDYFNQLIFFAAYLSTRLLFFFLLIYLFINLLTFYSVIHRLRILRILDLILESWVVPLYAWDK